MRIVVFVFGVVQIVSCHKRQVKFFSEAHQISSHIFLDRQAVIHHFTIKVTLTENIAEFCGGGNRLLILSQA